MHVALGFRLYMMRFGAAKLAAAYASTNRPSSSKEITAQVIKTLTKKISLPAEEIPQFQRYLSGKPGSRRYTPLRQALKRGEIPIVELQDLWLSRSGRKSSVGALTKNYFEDALSLAHILGLVRPKGNQLLSRGILSHHDPDSNESPFDLIPEDEKFLGLWLLDTDGDWLWAFLREMIESGCDRIRVDNRVDLLLATIDRLLDARQLRSGSSAYLTSRKRLIDIAQITRRNKREGLNLGQPWSWFLVPRIELLVDAGILEKDQPDQLTGYRLSKTGKALQYLAQYSERGHELIDGFFSAHLDCSPTRQTFLTWKEIHSKVEAVARKLVTPTGYYPLYETAASVCVNHFHSRDSSEPIWEIKDVEKAIRAAGGRKGAAVILGIDRQGHVYNFKFRC